MNKKYIFFSLLALLFYLFILVPYYTSKYECYYEIPSESASLPDNSILIYLSEDLQDSIIQEIIEKNALDLTTLIEKAKQSSFVTEMYANSLGTEKKQVDISHYIAKSSMKAIQKETDMYIYEIDVYLLISITTYNYLYPFGDYCDVYQIKTKSKIQTQVSPQIFSDIYDMDIPILYK